MSQPNDSSEVVPSQFGSRLGKVLAVVFFLAALLLGVVSYYSTKEVSVSEVNKDVQPIVNPVEPVQTDPNKPASTPDTNKSFNF